MYWLCSNSISLGSNVAQTVGFGAEFYPRGLVNMVHRSTQETKLCTAVIRAIREASSVEELIHHHQ